jgi:hypothetical protein
VEQEKDEKDDNLKPLRCGVEAEQLSFIEDLKNSRVFGSKRSAVVRAMLAYAMQQMAKEEFIQKYRAMREAARKA